LHDSKHVQSRFRSRASLCFFFILETSRSDFGQSYSALVQVELILRSDIRGFTFVMCKSCVQVQL